MMDEIEAAELLRSAAFKLSQSLLMHRKEKEQMQREKQQLEMTTANDTEECHGMHGNGNNGHIHEQQARIKYSHFKWAAIPPKSESKSLQRFCIFRNWDYLKILNPKGSSICNPEI
jgi:hypothetical protein